MKFLTVGALIGVALGATDNNARYNILSLDSAIYSGQMTAKFISYMELNAYSVARQKYNIPPRDSQRISMTELFDLIAGSETGAIIGANLAIPNDDPDTKATQKNKYFADHSVDFFEKNQQALYHDAKTPVVTKIIVIAILVGIASGLVYGLYKKYINMDQFEETAENFRRYLRKRSKAKDVDELEARLKADFDDADKTRYPYFKKMADLYEN